MQKVNAIYHAKQNSSILRPSPDSERGKTRNKERERERVDGEIHGHFEILRIKEKRQERRTSHVGPANADRPSGDQRGEDSRMRKASERRMTDDKETPGDADERELERQKGNKEAGTRENPT